MVTYALKVLSSYMLLMSTVFALPIFNIYLSSLICFDEDSIHGDEQCYQGIYFLHLIVAIIGFVIHFVTMILATSFYIDLNPWSTVPFASPQSKINLVKVLIKIGVVLYIILDYKKNITKEFIAVYGIIWLGVHILRYRQTPFYNRTVFRFVLGCESLILWACLVSNVHAFIDTDEVDTIGLFYLFFGMPFFAYAVITIIERRSVTYRRRLIKNFKKDNDVEMYINVIFHLIEHRDKPQSRMALEGLLKHHLKHCVKKESECACYALSRDFAKDEEPPEKLWYTWIKHIISDVLERFPKSTRLHMLYAYVQREKLHNKFKALYEMMITEENKPNMEEEFSIFSYKNVIEEEMIENDARNSESKGVDVNVIVDFQNKFVDFQAAVENDVDLHLEFWRELLENNPDIQKLQSLGAKITHSFEQTSGEFKKLNDINPNHIKMLQIYGNYLKDIVNDDVEGQRTLEKAEYVDKSSAVNKQFIDNDHLKYGENSNTCILTVSGNLGNLGIIKNVNNEITRILGYSKTELLGQNIIYIMPRFLSEIHDGFMRNYFESSDAKVIAIERIVSLG
jgi:ABC-type transport system involved in cytochrome c biogenesis permease subunit